jgi:arginase family enzyme
MVAYFSEESIEYYPFLFSYDDIMQRAPKRIFEILGISNVIHVGGGPPYDMKGWQEMMEELYYKMRNRASKKNFVLSIMCSTAPSIVAYLTEISGVSPKLIWLDAHPDINSLKSSKSGFFGGMPLGLIAGREFEGLKLSFFPKYILPPSNVIIYDARAEELSEHEFIKLKGIKKADNTDEVIKWTNSWEGPVYLHIDVDVLNPEIMPAIHFAEAGGMFPDEILKIFENIKDHQILAVNISGITRLYNSSKDKEEKSATVIQELAQKIIQMIK